MSQPGKRETVNVLDDFGPDASNVMVSASTPPKGMFSKDGGSAAFDNDDEEEEEDDDTGAGAGAGAPGAGTNGNPNPDDDEEEEEEEEDDDDAGAGGSALDEDLEDDDEDENGTKKGKGGRPTAMLTAIQKLIEKKVINPFEGDDKPLSEYTTEDFIELIEANMEDTIAKISHEAPLQVFSTLSPEVKQVVAYSLQGGQDWKSVMKAAISAKETMDLDVEKEQDQETICREWYTVTGTMTPDEVEEEIAVLKDGGRLKKQAETFKPKLDAKQASVMEAKLKEQGEAQKREEDNAKKYQASVYGVLNNTALNGVPLDQKTQSALYYGLTDRRYTDRKGNPTNELGYLLEQHQFGEKPNHALIAEALWLLRDPAAYKAELVKIGEAQSTLKTRRELRGAQGEGAGSTPSGTGKGSGTTVGVKRRTQQQPPAGQSGGNGVRKGFFSRD
jgi:hypothetical protein